jgi:hypothetical protein
MENEEELKNKLQEEREKLRLNSARTLKFLGYKGDTSKMTQEQLEARIEVIMENKKNEASDPKTPTPVLFQGIDEERENAEVAKATSPALTFEDLTSNYDALTAQIQVLRSNENVGHFENSKDVRILRLPASIKLDDNHSIIRRVLL